MKGDKLFITLFLLPMVIITGVFLYYPFFNGIIKSFYQSNGFFNSTFIGLDNYARLFKDEVIRIATFNSLEIMLYAVIFQVGIALILAVLVDSIKFGRGFFRTSFFFPVVISGAAIGLLFTLIYGYNYGMLNGILVNLGLERVLWINEKTSLLAVAIPTVWQYVGFYFVILLTAILKIPSDYYEAAKLDGITGFKRMVYITIPLIWSDIKICIILAITGAFRVFEMVYIITKGGPFNTSEVLGTYMYRKAITDQAFGYGATIAVYIVILGVALALITNRLLKREQVTY
ncbi:carbohydrate ABC transporter permease [Bacillus horti]|uniref:Raffinose/stachyose/melibiose transport system permease protein n=1 Tax=Caldalkalibacillus horti TaxID=77523 RepID=A0ABT9VVJ0_9BACI|nr:sugar ABC transporter permease [Bacillus horti]MDQ0164915.1 raffinose/stachyose/melibiose transport system permease protein [Bacillus horti]